MKYQPQERFITLPANNMMPETSIFTKIYAQAGELGQRDVMLCIPGGPGNDLSLYDSPDNSIAEALSPYVDIILFDPRGCGKSEKSPVEFCTLSNYIDDIENIRHYFNIPATKLIIFGQSYGSIAALGYTIKYYSSLKKLLLIGGAASSEFLTEAKHNLSTRGTPEQQQLGNIIWTGSFSNNPKDVAHFYQVMGPLYSYACQAEDPATEISITYNVAVLNFGFNTFLKNFDFRDQLSKVQCDTLILWGADDWICDLKQAQIINQGIINSNLKIYSQCSHMLWIDQWNKFLADTINFIASNSTIIKQ